VLSKLQFTDNVIRRLALPRGQKNSGRIFSPPLLKCRFSQRSFDQFGSQETVFNASRNSLSSPIWGRENLIKKNGEPMGSPFRNAVEEKRFTNTAARRIRLKLDAGSKGLSSPIWGRIKKNRGEAELAAIEMPFRKSD
jgi:hypothetical protein